MKAMILSQAAPVESSPLRLSELPLPEPGPGEIRLAVSVCGLCHTDLHTVEGDLALPRLPVVPGHQVIGRVEARGLGAQLFDVGDRVGVAWLNWACGECPYCRSGRENLCPEARFTGLHTDGGFAEAMIVDERFAFPIPDLFDDVAAAPLLCAGIVGYRALRLTEIRPGQRLGLYGFGASAHLVIQVARHWGCDVAVFTRSAAHRELALELGACFVGSATEPVDLPMDAGIVFAPAGWLVPRALSHLRPGGTVVINAIHMSPLPEMSYELIYHERSLRSVANFTRSDAEAFLAIAAEIPIRTEVEPYPLAQANDALRRAKESTIRAAAVLTVSCSG